MFTTRKDRIKNAIPKPVSVWTCEGIPREKRVFLWLSASESFQVPWEIVKLLGALQLLCESHTVTVKVPRVKSDGPIMSIPPATPLELVYRHPF